VYLLVYVVRRQDGHLHRHRLDAISSPSLFENFYILVMQILKPTTDLRVQL
jgi:hypothetical protein